MRGLGKGEDGDREKVEKLSREKAITERRENKGEEVFTKRIMKEECQGEKRRKMKQRKIGGKNMQKC